MTIYECLNKSKDILETLSKDHEKIDKYITECEFDYMLSAVERSMRTSSSLFLMYREMILSLYEGIPSMRGIVDADDSGCESMGISVEQIEQFDFPVYKIILPTLLPNVRRRKYGFYNAVTLSVNRAVGQYFIDNDIYPFYNATVFFVSYCDNPISMIDNDNKEASVIMNGLTGHFIRDDVPTVCATGYINKHVEDGPKTEIYIMDNDHDVEVLAYIKSL